MSTSDYSSSLQNLKSQFQARAPIILHSPSQKKLMRILSNAGTPIDRIVILGLGKLDTTDRCFEQILIAYNARRTLARLHNIPLKDFPIYSFDDAQLNHDCSEEFLEWVGITVRDMQGPDPEDTRPDTLYGIDPDLAEGQADTWTASMLKSDVSGPAALITDSTLVFMPYLPADPHCRVLVGKKPAIVVGHSAPWLKIRIDYYLETVVPKYPAYEEQLRKDAEVVRMLGFEYSAVLWSSDATDGRNEFTVSMVRDTANMYTVLEYDADV